MDGSPDDGSEVGFVGPLDLACSAAVPGASAHCALCDVRSQDCADDFRCVPWAEDDGDAWNGTKCIGTAIAPVEVGEACHVTESLVSGRDDCVPGAMCWDADPITLEGTCVPLCAPEGQRPECPAGAACMIDGLGVLALCLPTCDPLDASSCDPGDECRFLPASDAAFCIPTQGGRVLAPTIQCGPQADECPADAVCVASQTYGGCGAPSCCTAWCDLGEPSADEQCATQRPDQVCIPVFDRGRAPGPYAALGICAVPSAGAPMTPEMFG